MKVAVPREIVPGERRVALTPEDVAKLSGMGIAVSVEAQAGDGALFSDHAYVEAGATVEPEAARLLEGADVVLKVQRPVMNERLGVHEVDLLRSGAALVALLQPQTDLDLVRRLVARNVTAFSMDAIPRVARAQKMDALSSMASVAGYKAALMAATSLPKFFPMMITAAATLPPAKGFVLGAGVAGLQAIATAKRLGAVMSAYDVRPAVAEQVKSLGASFVSSEAVSAAAQDDRGYARELAKDTQAREREVLGRHAAEVDFVISTAAIPGRPAPLLITRDMVKNMRPGSVIVDVAAETGGNCELTKPGETIVAFGVTIHGPLNLPSTMPNHASRMFSRNISSFLLHMVKDGHLAPDFQDEVARDSCIVRDGKVLHRPTLTALEAHEGHMARSTSD